MSPLRRVLIIDDEPDIREIVKAVLEDLVGWQTLTAESGEVGLTLARTEPLDVLLLDISMPDIDGFELYQQLRQDPNAQTIPVVLLTAKVLPSDRRRFLDMGVAGVITKPFNPMRLANQIAQLLGWDQQD
jgi:CheY-like chemotaxis protein